MVAGNEKSAAGGYLIGTRNEGSTPESPAEEESEPEGSVAPEQPDDEETQSE